MLQFLCLFFPACLSMTVCRRIHRKNAKKKNLFDLLMAYGAFAFVDTTLALILTAVFGKLPRTCIEGSLNSDYISMKFMLVSIVVAVITGIAGSILEGYADYELTDSEEGLEDGKEA